MKKLSPAMMTALHFFVGGMDGYCYPPTIVNVHRNTFHALLDRKLVVISGDTIIPTQAGIDELGGLDAIADRKLVVNQPEPIEVDGIIDVAQWQAEEILPLVADTAFTIASLEGKRAKALVHRGGVLAGTIGINATLVIDDRVTETAFAERGGFLVRADTEFVIKFNGYYYDSHRYRTYRFDELEFIEEPVSKLNITPESLAATREAQVKTEALLASALADDNSIKLSDIKNLKVQSLVELGGLSVGSIGVVIDLSLDDLSLTDKQISTALKHPEKFNIVASSLLTVQFDKVVRCCRLDELVVIDDSFNPRIRAVELATLQARAVSRDFKKVSAHV